jgi:hypothetical protein
LTFPDDDQADAPLAAVRSEGFISPLTGRRILGYIAIPATVAMPVTAVSLDDGAIVEFEVGAPPPNTDLSIEFEVGGTEEFVDAILKTTWRGWEDVPVSSLPISRGIMRKSPAHDGSIE